MDRHAARPRALGLALALCLACAEAPGRPVVVATLPPLAWFVRALVPADAADVVTLVPAGASPTNHEPGFLELRALSHARLWVRVGHPHFAFEEAILAPLLRERSDLRAVAAWGGGAQGGDDEHGDPHVWLAPGQARALVVRLAPALALALPEAAPAVEARLPGLLAEIDALDRELGARLAPFAGKPFVVFHGAWGHLAEAYDLEQLALQHGHREPSLPALAALVARARAAGTHTVFVQPQFDRASATLVAEALGGRVALLDPLPEDWPAGLRATGAALAASFAR